MRSIEVDLPNTMPNQDNNTGLLDHLHGDIIEMREDIDNLHEVFKDLSESFTLFQSQTRLLIGALLQNHAPEILMELLTSSSDPLP